jgi:hypothetical protein
LKYLNGKDPGLFHSDTIKYQSAPGLGYQPRVRDAGGSIVVKDLHSAIKAIDTIVIQGEGSPGPYVDADKLEKDHYDIFLDLKEGDATWNTYPVLENPVTSDYCHLDKRIYQVNRFQYYLLEGLTNEELRRFQSHLMRRIASS